MGSHRELEPREAHDAAGFVELMRQLKQQSGLTYRQLEERATGRGEVLARSTLADALRSDSLPHAETLAVFLRACGEDRYLKVWLEARDRIASGPSPSGDGAPGMASREHESPRAGSNGAVPPDAGQVTMPSVPGRGLPWRTRPLRLAALASAAVILTVAVVAGTAYLPERTSQAVESPADPKDRLTSCRNGTCRGKDPQEYQCVGDAETTVGVKTEHGVISLWHSAACQAMWADILPVHNEEILSVYIKSDNGDVLSLKSDSLIEGHTPMLASQAQPKHGEVCVAYQEFEACADSDGVSRVKPYPSPPGKSP